MYVTGQASSVPLAPNRNTMDWVRAYVEQQIAKRALELTAPIIPFMRDVVGVRAFHLAGGALYKGKFNDLDIWSQKWNAAPYQKYVATRLKPGKTYVEQIICGVKVQLCSTPVGEELETLVNSFDFAHCKAGATVTFYDNSADPVTALGYVHPDFIAAMAVQGTFYTNGHKWPLNSLARVGKVSAKLGLSTEESMNLASQIVADLSKGDFAAASPGDAPKQVNEPAQWTVDG